MHSAREDVLTYRAVAAELVPGLQRLAPRLAGDALRDDPRLYPLAGRACAAALTLLAGGLATTAALLEDEMAEEDLVELHLQAIAYAVPACHDALMPFRDAWRGWECDPVLALSALTVLEAWMRSCVATGRELPPLNLVRRKLPWERLEAFANAVLADDDDA